MNIEAVFPRAAHLNDGRDYFCKTYSVHIVVEKLKYLVKVYYMEDFQDCFGMVSRLCLLSVF